MQQSAEVISRKLRRASLRYVNALKAVRKCDKDPHSDESEGYYYVHPSDESPAKKKWNRWHSRVVLAASDAEEALICSVVRAFYPGASLAPYHHDHNCPRNKSC